MISHDGLGFPELASLLTAAPELFLKVGKSVELQGGLRARTYLQRMKAELVVKVGSYAELARQQEYMERLPAGFRDLFPRFVVIRRLAESDEAPDGGVVVMERVRGRTLHRVLFEPRLPGPLRLSAVASVLDCLDEMHRYAFEGAPVSRDVALWCGRLRERLHAVAPTLRERSRLDGWLARLGGGGAPGTPPAECLLHGDAQGGNFVLRPAGGSWRVRCLDPLGGSGSPRGDYAYDLSRLYHWLDGAGECFERERGVRASFAARSAAFHGIERRAKALVLADLARRSERLGDHGAAFWFFLYVAFHLSGKLHDFRSLPSRRQLIDRIVLRLRQAAAAAERAREIHPTEERCPSSQSR